ncbi:MAG: type II secretion system protein GspL, partial [Rubrivivax sp.]|nr:type II secretion system protein GspL [Rubrivivax sp.]
LDDEALHFALPPEAVAGRPVWVAVTHRPWLQDTLARLESGGGMVDRVVPAAVPGGPAHGHFTPAPGAGDAEALQLVWTDADGATVFGLAGSLARTRAAAASAQSDPAPRWTATPAAAAAAEAWLGQPVAVLGEAERALAAARGGWNLRQFDLAPRHRGATAVRHAWRGFFGPEWRPVRAGLLALAAVQLLGLNAWAWQERHALDGKRAAMVALFRSTYPKVPAVLDAPLQMARETEALRAAAGQPGDTDLETLLAVAAAGWQDAQGKVSSLQFEPGRLVLGVPGWSAADAEALRAQLQPAGWAVTLDGELLTIARAPGAAP